MRSHRLRAALPKIDQCVPVRAGHFKLRHVVRCQTIDHVRSNRDIQFQHRTARRNQLDLYLMWQGCLNGRVEFMFRLLSVCYQSAAWVSQKYLPTKSVSWIHDQRSCVVSYRARFNRRQFDQTVCTRHWLLGKSRNIQFANPHRLNKPHGRHRQDGSMHLGFKFDVLREEHFFGEATANSHPKRFVVAADVNACNARHTRSHAESFLASPCDVGIDGSLLVHIDGHRVGLERLDVARPVDSFRKLV